MKHGVPFDVAFSIDEAERLAWCVVFAGFEGTKFDWTTGEYERPKP